jgi:hypothetical protein
VKIRLRGTEEQCREPHELLEEIMLVPCVRSPYQDRQRGETGRRVLVRVYVPAIPRGDRGA